MKNNDEYTYDKNGNIVIHSLTEYVQYIATLKKESEGSNEKFFFRGQANKNWDVRPSVFRDNVLSIEHDLIIDACARVPFEFGEHTNSFEKLTKLQHYGLPTRLLDVTMNPLVALYFACQNSVDWENFKNNNEFESEVESNLELLSSKFGYVDGVIYYKRSYDYKYNSKQVSIISELTEYEMNKGIELSELLLKFQLNINSVNDNSIYSKRKEFIDIIQKNYFVTSTFNNDRLIRQSGAFLLPGCFSVVHSNESINDAVVYKTKGSLNKEFESTTVIIPYDYKERILEELDFYNINLGSLFPELEQQMTYLRTIKGKQNQLTVGVFEKISKIQKDLQRKVNLEDIDTISKQVRKIKDKEIINIISKYVKDSCLQQGILKVLTEEMNYVDWYSKETIISDIRSKIKRYLVSNKVEHIDVNHCSTKIVNELLLLLK